MNRLLAYKARYEKLKSAYPKRTKAVTIAAYIVFGLLIVWGLVRTPIGQSFLANRFINIIEAKLGGGYGLTIERVSVRIDSKNNRPLLYFREIDILDKETGLHFISPAAEVILEEMSLTSPMPKVKGLTLVGPTLTIKSLTKTTTSGQNPKEVESEQKIPDLTKLLSDVLVRMVRDAQSIGLEKLSIANAKIVITSGLFGLGRTYENVFVNFDDLANGGAQINLEGKSDLGLSRATLTVSRTEEEKLEGDVLIENLALQDVMQALRLDFGTFRIGGEVSGTARLVADKDGLKIFETANKAKNMKIVFGPLSEDHIAFDNVDIAMDWSHGDTVVQLRPSLLTSGEGGGVIEGVFKISDDRQGLMVYLQGKNLRLAQRNSTQAPTQISIANLKGEARPAENKFLVHSAQIIGPTANASASGFFIADLDAVGGDFGIAIENTSAQSALSMWPPFISPQTRAAVERIVKAGVVNQAQLAVKVPPLVVIQQRENKPLPDDAIFLQATVSKADLSLGKDFPILKNANFKVSASGTRVDLENLNTKSSNIENELLFNEAKISLSDLFDSQITLVFEGKVKGEIAAFSSFISPQSNPSDEQTNSVEDGLLNGDVKLKAKLDSKTQALIPDTSNVVFKGDLKNLSLKLPNEFGTLKAPLLSVDYDGERTFLNGKILLDNQSGELRWDKHDNKKHPEIELKFISNDSWRNQKAPNFKTSVLGSVPIQYIQTDENGSLKQFIEADLTQATLEDPMPGVQKKSGVKGVFKAQIIKEEKKTKLNQIEIDAPQVEIRGDLVLNAKGQLENAHFPKYKAGVSQGLQISFSQDDKKQTIKVEGDALDVRPILKKVAQKDTVKNPKPIHISLKVKSAVGYNSEVISNLQTSLQQTGAKTSHVNASGDIGRGKFEAKSLSDSPDKVRIIATDAGAILRYVNVYKKISGGSLELISQMGAYPKEAEVHIRNFSVLGEPALKQYASGQDSEKVNFTKMKANFTESEDQFNVSEAVIWGDAVGVTFEGLIGKNDNLRITGTLVPAYALNNLFAQVPVIGVLLGGGNQEGVLGVAFRVTGTFSNPQLEISPLSAVAPGFLRKFFEFRKENQ